MECPPSEGDPRRSEALILDELPREVLGRRVFRRGDENYRWRPVRHHPPHPRRSGGLPLADAGKYVLVQPSEVLLPELRGVHKTELPPGGGSLHALPLSQEDEL